MLLISLIILFLGATAFVINIQYQDEIHKLIAILSGLIASFILFFLSPIIVKLFLIFIILIIINNIAFVYKS
ncbi:hypothetical protein [Cyanobacterium sp. Dongsha4]|uniref:hypothetical protein n=1 Tax=Cyanobacterium sp. DS4 TaxID=2878255 RepID=UPI002E80924E|nr:hypothetical protein [Cyanobacterium sp. Dongsha4]WVL00199.1 hypothetical protein Dongsha4_16325 [Cyanobacterium sp. Dongsha4]